MKLISKVKVKNNLGLHIRPASLIVKVLQPLGSSVFFTFRNETINARSIMSILMLVAKKNSSITITVEGEDAEKTMNTLKEVFESGFGEL